jgi:hypothetical protein
MSGRVKEWVWRYGPAEIVSLLTTLVPAIIVQSRSGNAVAAALAGTWGGNVGYFGTILIRDMLLMQRALHTAGKSYTLTAFGRNVRALLIEFGVAEIFDSLLVRPALMYYLPVYLGDFSVGIIVAKFLADITFYLPAIIFYEWSKGRFRKY